MRNKTGCYHCGKVARWQCDFTDNGVCSRVCCDEHSVPEFEGQSRETWALCMHHAFVKGRWEGPIPISIEDYEGLQGKVHLL